MSHAPGECPCPIWVMVPPPVFFLEARRRITQNLAASSFVTKLASFAGEKKFSGPVLLGCLDFGGIVEGQILKAVDSAIEGL